MVTLTDQTTLNRGVLGAQTMTVSGATDLTRVYMFCHDCRNAVGCCSSVDQALLDTNQNGVLDAGDDSLAPYYPGDDLVACGVLGAQTMTVSGATDLTRVYMFCHDCRNAVGCHGVHLA
jgi:uncharacterized protein YfkK (UPF0435 family)